MGTQTRHPNKRTCSWCIIVATHLLHTHAHGLQPPLQAPLQDLEGQRRLCHQARLLHGAQACGRPQRSILYLSLPALLALAFVREWHMAFTSRRGLCIGSWCLALAHAHGECLFCACVMHGPCKHAWRLAFVCVYSVKSLHAHVWCTAPDCEPGPSSNSAFLCS